MKDDARLVQQTLAGDPEAFRGLVRRYQTPTYVLALSRVRNAVAADEIAQDAFVSAYQKLSQLKDRSRFAAWLRAITLRRCALWFRSGKQGQLENQLAEELTPDPAAANPASGADGGALGIAAMIERLPERLRVAALLCFDDELSPRAAAAVLGIKGGTLRKRLHDARARLHCEIIHKAIGEGQSHLLPRNFAERCVCRCVEGTRKDTGKEVKGHVRREKMRVRLCACIQGCNQNQTEEKGKTDSKKMK
ncbi:MAG: hypothetical protein A2498_16660 [Lentisphaerae bacterium RIFOXYC12_FULL_60_16]|nr:MAG: hypothetical protein A2498_16660 [Lentisphaerae bacterium RIFOXYC12_FULL_60_16]OGV84467.1 MAG: hypothetical protein A2340_04015 [Lentisphaerae bacterium RIFOXYB12_FULL_60_10]